MAILTRGRDMKKEEIIECWRGLPRRRQRLATTGQDLAGQLRQWIPADWVGLLLSIDSYLYLVRGFAASKLTIKKKFSRYEDLIEVLVRETCFYMLHMSWSTQGRILLKVPFTTIGFYKPNDPGSTEFVGAVSITPSSNIGEEVPVESEPRSRRIVKVR
jgi:hypothetical protein